MKNERKLLIFHTRIKWAKFYAILWLMEIKWRLWNHLLISLKQKGETTENISTMILEKSEKELIFKIAEGKHMTMLQWWLVYIIKKINHTAEFVACTNHLLNLVDVHASSVAAICYFFGCMEYLYFLFYFILFTNPILGCFNFNH